MSDASTLQARILLVDDDVPVARLSQRLLERMGYQVETYHDPREAFERLTSAPDTFDAVITDHRMPGMTGQELLARARDAGVFIPAMMVSGYAEEVDRELLDRIGVQTILDKPFTSKQMRAVLERLFQRGSSSEA